MICQSCGIEAPTKYVVFDRCIGAALVHFHKSVKGEFCKSCVHRYFWSYTPVTLLFGWWSHLSWIINPFFLLNNFFRYATCLTMPAVPLQATEPQLTEKEIEKLRPYTEQLLERLNQKKLFKETAEDIAQLVGVTPGQVVCYVQALIAVQKESEFGWRS